METSTKKAAIALLNQIKTTVVTLEDLILSTEVVFRFDEKLEETQKIKKTPNNGDLTEDEDKNLEDSLERERLAILESDKVLKDLWAQGAR
jgi:hypothetical protein